MTDNEKFVTELETYSHSVHESDEQFILSAAAALREQAAELLRLRKAVESLRCGCLYGDCYTSRKWDMCHIGTWKHEALEEGE